MEMGKVNSYVYFSYVYRYVKSSVEHISNYVHSICTISQLLFRKISDITVMKSEYREDSGGSTARWKNTAKLIR